MANLNRRYNGPHVGDYPREYHREYPGEYQREYRRSNPKMTDIRRNLLVLGGRLDQLQQQSMANYDMQDRFQRRDFGTGFLDERVQFQERTGHDMDDRIMRIEAELNKSRETIETLRNVASPKQYEPRAEFTEPNEPTPKLEEEKKKMIAILKKREERHRLELDSVKSEHQEKEEKLVSVVKSLKKKFELSRVKIRRLMEENEGLKSKAKLVDELSTQNQLLSDNLRKVNEKLSDTTNQLTQLKLENASLNSETKGHAAGTAAAMMRIEALSKDKVAAQNSLNAALQEKDLALEQAQNYANLAAKYENDLQKMRENTKVLKSEEIDRLQSHLIDARSKIATLHKEVAELKRKIDSEYEENLQYQRELEKKDQDISKLILKKSELDDRIEEVMKESAVMKAQAEKQAEERVKSLLQRDGTQKDLTVLQARHTEMERKMGEYERLVADQTTIIKTLDTKVTLLEEQNTILVKERNQAVLERDEHKKKETFFEQQVTQLRLKQSASMEDLAKSVVEAKTNLEKANLARKTWESKAKQFEEDLNFTVQENSRISDENEALRGQLEDLKEQNLNQLENLVKERVKVAEEGNEAVSSAYKWQAAAQELENEKRELEEKLIEKSQTLEVLKNENSALALRIEKQEFAKFEEEAKQSEENLEVWADEGLYDSEEEEIDVNILSKSVTDLHEVINPIQNNQILGEFEIQYKKEGTLSRSFSVRKLLISHASIQLLKKDKVLNSFNPKELVMGEHTANRLTFSMEAKKKSAHTLLYEDRSVFKLINMVIELAKNEEKLISLGLIPDKRMYETILLNENGILITVLLRDASEFTCSYLSQVLYYADAHRATIEWLSESERSRSLGLICTLVYTEISKTQQESSIFRTNSVTTKYLKQYFKLVGSEYITTTLSPTLSTVSGSFELDESKPGYDPSNSDTLCEFVDRIMTDILRSTIPIEIVRVLSFVGRTVRHRFEGAETVAMTGLFFLRYLVPAIIGFNPKASRNYILVAKVVQNIANQVEFGEKEKYMTSLNHTVREWMPKVRTFMKNVAESGMIQSLFDEIELTADTTDTTDLPLLHLPPLEAGELELDFSPITNDEFRLEVLKL